MPTVLLNSAVESPPYSVLNIDNYGGAAAMVRHLVDVGHRDIAFIGGPTDNFDAQQRELGYRAGHGRILRPAAVPAWSSGDFTEESGYRAGQALLAQGRAAGRRVRRQRHDGRRLPVGVPRGRTATSPNDIAVAGFDDIPIARYVAPTLTTVRVRIVDLGRSALERLAALLDASDQIPASADTLGCEIVVRESCGAGRPHNIIQEKPLTGTSKTPFGRVVMKAPLHLKKKLLASVIATAVVSIGAAPSTAWSQSAYATLRGKAPANTEITAFNPATGTTRHATSSADGSYTMTGLQPGTYQVDAGPGTQKTVTLTVASTSTLNLGRAPALGTLGRQRHQPRPA